MKKAEGIPIGPFPAEEQAKAPGTPISPGEHPAPATAREKALEHTIEKIKGLGTMRELKAAGIEYNIPTALWRFEIGDFVYARRQLRDLLGILTRLHKGQSAELGIVYRRLNTLDAAARDFRAVVAIQNRTLTKKESAALASLDKALNEIEEKENEEDGNSQTTTPGRAAGAD